ncbi:MAG TPA: glycosyl transferase family 2, partial [Blastocatellia bacterium]|nr:glycosyl transferase family 2 [Blastocatellia bacterium]
MRGYFKKALRVLKSEGVAAAFDAAMRQTEILRLNREYRRWLLQNGQLTPEEREEAARRIADFAHQPLISILMPVYNTPEKWLRAAIDSVRRQIYPHWELCIADDYSDQTHIRKILEEYTAADERIKVVLRDANGHISAASNSALELVTGEFTALMDHDDELSEDALFHIAAEINRLPSVNLLYTDEDKIDSRGNRFYPWLKPDWSPDLFYSMNLLAHLCVYRTQVLRRIGGFRESFEGSQDYDLALRFIEYVPPESICHIPRILYHWRSIRGSAAFDASEKEYAAERGRIAVNEHFERTGISARCVAGRAGLHRLKYYGNPDNANVSIIIAVRKARSDLRKILQKLSVAPRTEIILAGDFAESDPAGDERVMTHNVEDKGLFYVLNRAAQKASGDIIIFLDESVLAVSENWISELAGRAGGKGIGAVSPMILDDTGRIIHAGYLLGING